MANVPSRFFLGTAQTVIDLATDIASGNFSGAPAATYDNTSDGVVPYAPYAKVMAEFPDWAAAPGGNLMVELWGVLKDTDGTDDDTDPPATSAPNGAVYFGQFVIDDVDALQRRTIVIDTLGMEKIDFYLYNNTSQSMNNDGGTNCVVKVTPCALGVVT
jgi:hypothetical protein